MIHLVNRKFKDLDSTITLTQIMRACDLSPGVHLTRHTSRGGSGVKVDLDGGNTERHWAADCQPTFFLTCLSSRIWAFPNSNIAAMLEKGRFVSPRR